MKHHSRCHKHRHHPHQYVGGAVAKASQNPVNPVPSACHDVRSTDPSLIKAKPPARIARVGVAKANLARRTHRHLLGNRNLGGFGRVAHFAENLDQLLPRLGPKICAKMISALAIEPVNPGCGIGRANDPVITQTIKNIVSGLSLDTATLEMLGTAVKITIDKENTTIVSGDGNSAQTDFFRNHLSTSQDRDIL